MWFGAMAADEMNPELLNLYSFAVLSDGVLRKICTKFRISFQAKCCGRPDRTQNTATAPSPSRYAAA